LIRGILCVSCDPAGMWPGVWHRLGARERGRCQGVRRKVRKKMAARQGACRRCDSVTTVTCAPAESMPRREGRAWHRERRRCNAERRGARCASATRCSPEVRMRRSGEEQRAVASVARGDPDRRSFRKRCQRVWRSIVAKHAGVLGPGHGCVTLPATTLVTSARVRGKPGPRCVAR
jgi:hypothetical protein